MNISNRWPFKIQISDYKRVVVSEKLRWFKMNGKISQVRETVRLTNFSAN